MRDCKYLCLVGGLSISKYFQSKMRMEFGKEENYNLTVIMPARPVLSVVEGAAYSAITHNYIKARRLRCTYGVDVSVCKDCFQNNFKKPCNGPHTSENEYLPHYFKIMATKNEEIKCREYVTITAYSSKSGKILVEIFASDKKDPKFTTSEHRMAWMEISAGYKRERWSVEFHFYDTVIKVTCFPTDNPKQKKYIRMNYV